MKRHEFLKTFDGFYRNLQRPSVKMSSKLRPITFYKHNNTFYKVTTY